MKNLINRYIYQPTNVMHIQFLRYGIVGMIAAIVDIGTFYIFNVVLSWHYIAAQSIAFFVGVFLNYILSTLWIFQSCHRRRKEIFIFIIVGLGGLLMSYFSLYFLIDVIKLTYLNNFIAKIVTVAIVFVWNFVLRKKFVFV